MKIKVTAEDRMIAFYRTISLSLTSFMFLMVPAGPSVIYKSLLIIVLFLFAQVFTFYYRRLRARLRILKLVIGIELTGIIVLTLFTGGMTARLSCMC